jgi:oxygen-independent coproporphyrinogen-3 oxidase
MRQYVQKITQELGWWKEHLVRTDSRIDTVFFGGGTPSMLPRDLMRELLGELRTNLPLEAGVEWTIEANPASLDRAYQEMLLENGVNRLSVGVQSFIEQELKTLGRVHGSEDARQAVISAREAGFERVSVDLMYATPGQTQASWLHSLEEAVNLGTGHLSCYCLTLEEGTPMHRLMQLGRMAAVPEELQLEYMKTTRAYLKEQGFEAYEISNYARPGQECRHNIHYWRGDNYIGLGPGAASHVGGQRWRNHPDLAAYISQMGCGRLPVEDAEMLSPQQRVLEMLMLGLRMASGLNWADVLKRTGLDGRTLFAKNIGRLQKLSLLECNDHVVRLSERGLFVADSVIGELVRQVEKN